jgi:hypothetical protein
VKGPSGQVPTSAQQPSAPPKPKETRDALPSPASAKGKDTQQESAAQKKTQSVLPQAGPSVTSMKSKDARQALVPPKKTQPSLPSPSSKLKIVKSARLVQEAPSPSSPSSEIKHVPLPPVEFWKWRRRRDEDLPLGIAKLFKDGAWDEVCNTISAAIRADILSALQSIFLEFQGCCDAFPKLWRRVPWPVRRRYMSLSQRRQTGLAK